jgi:hypothetical protein
MMMVVVMMLMSAGPMGRSRGRREGAHSANHEQYDTSNAPHVFS